MRKPRPVDSDSFSPKYEIWDVVVDTSHLALLFKVKIQD